MTDKVTLAHLSSLSNSTTAINTINSNSDAITTAIDNTLSRDGTSPNQMGANLDMNNSRIINLPAPISVNEPMRLSDANALITSGSITFNSIPVGGTAGQVLRKNSNTDFDAVWSNTITTTNDTNVTLSFNASSNLLTAGWTSTLANSRVAPGTNNTVKGTTSGAVTDLTQTQVTALINTFTTSLSGAAPASGGGTSNFLRADGTWTVFSTPTIQTFTSSTTYTPTTGATKIKIRMVGGGGGGGSQASSTAATAGGTSAFQIGATTSWTAVGGSGGLTTNGAGGSGGSGGVNGSTGTLVVRIPGGMGGGGGAVSGGVGYGGNSPVFVGGAAALGAQNTAGNNAVANTGGGGGGGGSSGVAYGSGGGSGEYVEFWASALTSTCTVATGGVGGTAGTRAGGNGAAGIIIVEEFYY